MSCFQMRLDAALFQVTFPDHAIQRVVITDEHGRELTEMKQLGGGWYALLPVSGPFDDRHYRFMSNDLNAAAAAAVRTYQRENDREAVMA